MRPGLGYTANFHNSLTVQTQSRICIDKVTDTREGVSNIWCLVRAVHWSVPASMFRDSKHLHAPWLTWEHTGTRWQMNFWLNLSVTGPLSPQTHPMAMSSVLFFLNKHPCLILFFLIFYLFMIVTERDRGRDTGRGRSRLHAGSPMRNLIPGLQDQALSWR